MLLQVSTSWDSLEDYFQDLQSKYRLRVRKALHASTELMHREFTAEELKNYQPKIFELYNKTADGSDFNLVKLHDEYFYQLKIALQDNYRIFGFFKNDELIAFYSYVADGHELMGHFLGTMKENNNKYQVYMNILLKYIEHGIQSKFTVINLARTAIEIKSSVGAVPTEMVCYLTHRNKMYNAFVPNLLRYLKPEEEYVIRMPFKKSKTAHS
jgi:predicted N-acyltransferase